MFKWLKNLFSPKIVEVNKTTYVFDNVKRQKRSFSNNKGAKKKSETLSFKEAGEKFVVKTINGVAKVLRKPKCYSDEEVIKKAMIVSKSLDESMDKLDESMKELDESMKELDKDIKDLEACDG